MVLAALGLHESSALLVAGENVPKRSGLRLEIVERVEVGRHPRADVVHRGDHSADGGEDPGAGQLGRVQTAVEVDTESWCQVREVGVVEPGAREPERSEDVGAHELGERPTGDRLGDHAEHGIAEIRILVAGVGWGRGDCAAAQPGDQLVRGHRLHPVGPRIVLREPGAHGQRLPAGAVGDRRVRQFGHEATERPVEVEAVLGEETDGRGGEGLRHRRDPVRNVGVGGTRRAASAKDSPSQGSALVRQRARLRVQEGDHSLDVGVCAFAHGSAPSRRFQDTFTLPAHSRQRRNAPRRQAEVLQWTWFEQSGRSSGPPRRRHGHRGWSPARLKGSSS